MPDAAFSLAEARAQGIEFFLQGGVGPEDWERQRQLALREPGILTCFGLHPYWIADHSRNECESALDQLARELPKASALGETGLDFRTHIVKDSHSLQIECFESQLEMARVANKAVVLHVVRAFEESLRVLDLFGAGTRGMVHAFTGSAAKAEEYLKRGYLLSVGGPVCRPDFTRLHQAVAVIPLESILVETDSPDQSPPGIAEGQNTPLTILRVADEIAKIKKVSRAQVLDMSRQNLRKLLSP